jgi:hypothetical protein
MNARPLPTLLLGLAAALGACGDSTTGTTPGADASTARRARGDDYCATAPSVTCPARAIATCGVCVTPPGRIEPMERTNCDDTRAAGVLPGRGPGAAPQLELLCRGQSPDGGRLRARDALGAGEGLRQRRRQPAHPGDGVPRRRRRHAGRDARQRGERPHAPRRQQRGRVQPVGRSGDLHPPARGVRHRQHPHRDRAARGHGGRQRRPHRHGQFLAPRVRLQRPPAQRGHQRRDGPGGRRGRAQGSLRAAGDLQRRLVVYPVDERAHRGHHAGPRAP